MSDEFLSRHEEPPRDEFRSALRRRLHDLAAEEAPEVSPSPTWARLRPLLASGVGLAAAVVAFSFPSVRAAARDFLDSFRVRSFAAIAVDPERFSRLEGQGVNLETLLGDSIEVLEEPGEPVRAESLKAAAEMAGISIDVPSGLPEGTSIDQIQVGGRGLAVGTLDTSLLEDLLSLLEVEGVEVPHELDGLTVTLETPPPVTVTYQRGKDTIRLVQSEAPRVDLPESVDLERLGEIGLRLCGLSAEEARIFAGNIDWGSTLLIPVPVNAATFREVDVAEGKGLLVTFLVPEEHRQGRGRWRSLLFWANEDRVFALEARGQGIELLRWANTMG